MDMSDLKDLRMPNEYKGAYYEFGISVIKGFPTLISGGPHTCQSGLKVGRIKQN